MMVKGIALDNFILLELSRAVNSKGSVVLHLERVVAKEITFGQFEAASFHLCFLLYILYNTLLIKTIFLVSCTAIHVQSLRQSLRSRE